MAKKKHSPPKGKLTGKRVSKHANASHPNQHKTRPPGSGAKAGPRANLKPRQLKFVEEYLRNGNNGAQAYMRAYETAAGDVTSRASRLLNHPAVKAELAKRQDKIRGETEYTVRKGMEELDEAMQFARETDNATAYVKAVELRGKLNGLYVEKHEHFGNGLTLQIGGIAPPPQVLPPAPEAHELTEEEYEELPDELSAEEDLPASEDADIFS